MNAERAPSAQAVRRALDEIKDPCSVAASVPIGLEQMGMVESIKISGNGHVEVGLRLTSPSCEMIAFLRRETQRRVARLPAVTGVSVRQDRGLDWEPEMIAPDAQARRRQALRARMTAAGMPPRARPARGA
jgi:metal-sulfur cluster biosynthetic enzyme